MDWSEDGIVVSVRPHGESSAVVELFTRTQGRHLGLVRGGRSKRMRPLLQPGNSVHATWRARLAEHLGQYTLEPAELRAAALMDDPTRLAALTTLMSHVQLVAEREAHERLHDALLIVLGALNEDDNWAPLMVRWELGLLEELGFGLDLAACAATGTREDLHFVSPKSGRAVSAAAAAPYKERLFELPAFLRGLPLPPPGPDAVQAGFALTGFFLERHVFAPRAMAPPEARDRLIRRLARL